MAAGIEAGYDIMPWFSERVAREQKLYAFARYEYYDSYIPAPDQQDYTFTDRHRIAAGINWFPIPEIAVKAEYSRRFLASPYNDEPSVNIGIAYMTFFKR